MSVPELEIGQDAFPHIDDVSYNGNAYATYLGSRGVSEEDIAALQIRVTNEGVPRTATATYASPLLTQTGRHEICLSPTSISRNPKKQGNILRHETEHFIQYTQSENEQLWLLCQQVSCVALTGAGASTGGLAGFHLGDILSPFSSTVTATQVGAELGGAALIGTVGTVAGISIFALAKAHSPSELRAFRAQRTQRLALPDGTLYIDRV